MRLYHLFFSALIAFSLLTACQEEKDKPTEELKEFVTQVEHSIEDGEIKDWTEFEREFYTKWDELEASTKDMSDEVKAEMNQLKGRFEAAKNKWEKDS
jgi:hypothetical protein